MKAITKEEMKTKLTFLKRLFTMQCIGIVFILGLCTVMTYLLMRIYNTTLKHNYYKIDNIESLDHGDIAGSGSDLDIYVRSGNDFESYQKNVYVYVGRDVTLTANMDLNRIRTYLSSGPLLKKLIIRSLDNNRRIRLRKLLPILNTSEYWYRISWVNADDAEFYMIEAFCIDDSETHMYNMHNDLRQVGRGANRILLIK